MAAPDPFKTRYFSAPPDLAQTLHFRLNHKGWEALSDAEVLSLSIGGNKSALEVAGHLLASVSYSLPDLGRLTLPELRQLEGVGQAKALAVGAAMELARRRNEADLTRKVFIRDSKDVFNLLKADLMDLRTEEFWVVLLNRANGVLRKVLISGGGVSGTVADPKVIFKAALDCLAASVILVHNHPSGNRSPSSEDVQLTKKLSVAGKLLEIPIIDHIIFAGEVFYSFADEGLL